MLETLGFDSLDTLMDAAVPGGIRTSAELDLPSGQSEDAVARELREIAAENNPGEPMIGLGYHATITPPVIRRNVLEDPSWYTAYTPYQPEISQGRLEALINFQTVVGDLTGLPTANASLLDEGTAVAEAMTLVRRADRKATGPFVVDSDALPQTIEVVRTRAEAMGIEVVVADLADGVPAGDALRRAAAVPRRLGPDPRPARAGRGRRRPGRQARRGRRPARARPARVARGARGRRGRRLVPALRRPAVLRRPARRLHGGRGGPRAAPARSAGRRERRRRGASGVPPGPADPGAAHPPRQGDLQHLHRPGAAGRRGVDVRRPPRSRGAAHHRAPHPSLRRRAGRGVARGRRRGGARRVLRHRAGAGPGPRRGRRRRGPCDRGPAASGRRRPRRDLVLGADRSGHPREGAGRLRRGGRRAG